MGGTVIVVGIFIAIFIFGKSMFASPNIKIVGTWKTENGFTFVFNSNGQYSHSGGWNGTYTVEEDLLTLSPILNNPEIYRISLSSDSLKLYDKDGYLYRDLKRVK